MSLLRRLTKKIHRLDHHLGRVSRQRLVLVEMRTPVYQAVLGPICDAIGDQSEVMRSFRRAIFSRIVPAIKKIGLLTPKVAEAYAALGVLEFQDNRTTDEELLADG